MKYSGPLSTPIAILLALTLFTSADSRETVHSKSSEDEQNAVFLNLTISQPESNDFYSLGDAELGLDFIAEVEANGVEDPMAIHISWSSNREDFLGTGNMLLQVPLEEPGTHTITAFVEDGPANQASKSLEIGVLPLDPMEGETIEELAQKGSEESRASIAATARGGSVVAWQGDFGTEISSQERSVQVTLLNSQDQHETTLRVSDSLTETQSNPHLASNEEGLFMVVWESREGSMTQVKGRIFFRMEPNGIEPIGNEFLLSEQKGSILSKPQVVIDGRSGFIAVWQQRPPGSVASGDIFARRFDRVGTPAGDPFRVNSQNLGEQRNPSIASLPGRGFVAVWESSVSQERANIHLRRFDFLDQALDDDDLRINLENSGLHSDPRVATSSEGDFVVVWKSTTLSSKFPAAQTFRIASRPGENLHFTDPDFLFEEFIITETIEAVDEPFDPAVAMNRDGDFLVTWAEGSGSDSSSRVRYQTFFFLQSEPRASSDIRALDFSARGHPATAFTGTNLNNEFLVFWNATENTSDSSSTDLLGNRISLSYESFLPTGFIFYDGFDSGEPSGWTRVKGLS